MTASNHGIPSITEVFRVILRRYVRRTFRSRQIADTVFAEISNGLSAAAQFNPGSTKSCLLYSRGAGW